MKRKYNKFAIKSKDTRVKIKPLRPNLQFTPANESSSVKAQGIITGDKVGLRGGDNQEKLRGVISTLSQKEKLVYELIFIKRKPVKQAADTLNCNVGNIYKKLNNIEKKDKEGIIFKERGLSDPLGDCRAGDIKTLPNIIKQEFENNQERLQNGNRGAAFKWRFHGIQLHILFHINDCDNGGAKLKRKIGSHDFKAKGITHTITAHKPDKFGYASMDVYIKGEGVWGDSSDAALNRGKKEIKALCELIQWDYGVHFIKLRPDSIRIVKGHLVEVGNELACQYVYEKRIFKVRGKNGKVWLEIDWSIPGLKPEIEVHGDAETLKPDVDCVGHIFNVYREHPELPDPLQEHNNIIAIQQTVQTMVGTLQQVVTTIAEYPKTKRDEKDAMFR